MAHDPRYAYSLIKSEIKAAKTYRVEKIDLLVPEQETQLDHSQLTTFSPRLPDSDTFNCSDPEKVDSELIRMSVSRMHAASMLENTDSYKVSYIWAREGRSHVVMADRNGAHMCTCAMVIRYGLPCRHFFATMYIGPTLRGQSGFT